MIVLLAAISLSAAANGPQRDDDVYVAVRVDCDVTAIRHFGENFGQSEPDGTSRYVFLFPRAASAGARVKYLYTLDDGRSWLRQATVKSLVGDSSASFAADLDTDYFSVRLASNPDTKGRIQFGATPYLLTDAGGSIEQRGECQITSPAEKAKAQ